MLYGLLFGAPGALAYKAVNTLDSMVGHPQAPLQGDRMGSARLDDLANILPSTDHGALGRGRLRGDQSTR